MSLPPDDKPRDPTPEPFTLPDRLLATPPTAGRKREVRPVLGPGEMVAGRYRIVEFIAHGGMGEVYEAEDVDLRERVALKTILAGFGEDDHSLERFRREISHARKVTHPNVCRVFDLGYHTLRDASGAEQELAFLTMELLAGETLTTRLRRAGPLATSDALPIAAQMAAGLDAAHRAGLVHRDFKTGNVMLVPLADGGLRAVITDFGLARPDASLSPETLTLSTNPVVGTPAYMAPEQLQGGDVTAATDIYAFGLVLYEMVTGVRPFAGETLLAAAFKRLSAPPPSPRSHVPDLDTRWEGTILKCLELDPSTRFSNAQEVIAALEGRIALPAPVAEVAARRARRRVFALLGVLAVALGVSYALGLGRPQSPVAARLPPVTARRSVAVLGIQDLSGRADRAWLGTALAEMLTADLGAGGRLRAIPQERAARAVRDLTLPKASGLTPEVLARVHAFLGSDLVVLGSHVTLGPPADAQGALRLELLLQDAKSGQLIETVSEEGTETLLAELVSRCGARLRQRLGASAVPDAEAGAARQWGLPRILEALRPYTEGLERLHLGDALGARDPLQKAASAEPSSPRAHSALAEAWAGLGYEAKAKEEAERALALAEGLPREDRLAIEGRFRTWAGQPNRAEEAYRALFDQWPDDVEHGLRLAAAQIAGSQAGHALVTIAALRRIPSPVGGDPRIDLAEARAAAALSDFPRQRSAAARAATEGMARGSPAVVVSGRLLEAAALEKLGQLRPAWTAAEEAKSAALASGDRSGAAAALMAQAYLGAGSDSAGSVGALQKARELFHEAGDRRGEATAIEGLARVVRAGGDLPAARKTYEEALAIRREIADRKGASATLRDVALVQTALGDASGARATYEQALAELGDGGKNGATLQLELARLYGSDGDWAEAERSYGEAVASLREAGEGHAAGAALRELGGVLTMRGNLVGAKRAFGEALTALKDAGDPAAASAALADLAHLLLLQGDLAAARALLEEARDARRKAGDTSGTAVALVELAQVLLEQGEISAAVASNEEALRLLGNRPDRLRSRTLDGLGAALLSRGDVAEARRKIEEARDIRKRQGDAPAIAESNLALAWLALGEGRFPDAEASAREAADTFRSGHLVSEEAEAEVALSRALLESGKMAPAQTAVVRAQALAGDSERVPLRLAVALASARLRVRLGQVAAAATETRAVLEAAERAGLGRLRLEAGLTLGEVEMAAGRQSAGRDRLVALEREATARGWSLLARRVSAAAGREASTSPAPRP